MGGGGKKKEEGPTSQRCVAPFDTDRVPPKKKRGRRRKPKGVEGDTTLPLPFHRTNENGKKSCCLFCC